MSSIISDLFYGSKQNILDNYLVNRHEANQQSSMQQPQGTVLYASFIQFYIRLPNLGVVTGKMLLRVEIQMGNRSDEGFIEIGSGQNQGASIILTINELEKQDLNKYTNIKITVSEGKYSKIHGFIPIESIKNIASSFSNQKTIVVQMKGKKTLPFSSVQCTIRTQFPNNNVLNSEIMKSLEKDHESYLRSKHQISDSSNHSQSQPQVKQAALKNRKNSSTFNQKSMRHKRKSQNIIIEESNVYNGGQENRNRANQKEVTEFVKEIKSVRIHFTKIELGQALKVSNEQIKLQLGDKVYSISEIIEISQITRQGINIDILIEDKSIGAIHLSPLLLTLDKICGELPIYSAQEKCLGTIVVESPDIQQKAELKKPINKQRNLQTVEKQAQAIRQKQLFLLSIDKIVMVNSRNSLNESSLMDETINQYDFSKMELSKLEVLIRINASTYKFTDVVLHYTMDRQIMKIVELRRKEGFIVRYFEQSEESNLNVEIQIFSAYRLISYSKVSISREDRFAHKFITGDTSSPFLHCGIYLKGIRVQAEFEYFQQHKIGTVFNVLEDILSNRIIINQADDHQIKAIMNVHKKITYIEMRKLLTLIEKHMREVYKFQRCQLGSVLSRQTPQRSEAYLKIGQRLLEQFLYVDSKSQKVIDLDEFQKILEFYREDLQISLQQQCQSFIANPIKRQKNIIYIFFVIGYFFIEYESSVIPEEPKSDVKIEIAPEILRCKEETNRNITQVAKEISMKVQPSYFLSKVIITNAHLLNLGKAPNISLNIAKRVCYSNSNPEFTIEKEINLLDGIQIYHKSIAQDRLILLAEFKPNRRETYYQLQPTGKAFAKIVWGL